MYRSNWYHSNTSFKENFYVDISKTWKLKEKAISQHKSEMNRTGKKWINFFYNELPIVKIRIGDKTEKYKESDYLNNTERLELLEIKNKIDLENIRDWDKAKKNSNDYELIHLPARKLKHESIAAYEPLSRSYFKMWEILHNYGFFQPDQQKAPINILIKTLLIFKT